MNCIREAENYLRYYRDLHQSIEPAEYMISKLVKQTAPSELSAVPIDITGIRAGKPANTLNQMYQLQVDFVFSVHNKWRFNSSIISSIM